jgi:hypothetical protein
MEKNTRDRLVKALRHIVDTVERAEDDGDLESPIDDLVSLGEATQEAIQEGDDDGLLDAILDVEENPYE